LLHECLILKHIILARGCSNPFTDVYDDCILRESGSGWEKMQRDIPFTGQEESIFTMGLAGVCLRVSKK
jgi:hypothetical protein